MAASALPELLTDLRVAAFAEAVKHQTKGLLGVAPDPTILRRVQEGVDRTKPVRARAAATLHVIAVEWNTVMRQRGTPDLCLDAGDVAALGNTLTSSVLGNRDRGAHAEATVHATMRLALVACLHDLFGPEGERSDDPDAPAPSSDHVTSHATWWFYRLLECGGMEKFERGR